MKARGAGTLCHGVHPVHMVLHSYRASTLPTEFYLYPFKKNSISSFCHLTQAGLECTILPLLPNAEVPGMFATMAGNGEGIFSRQITNKRSMCVVKISKQTLANHSTLRICQFSYRSMESSFRLIGLAGNTNIPRTS